MRVIRSILNYRCPTCPAKGWRKYVIHNCAEERGEGW